MFSRRRLTSIWLCFEIALATTAKSFKSANSTLVRKHQIFLSLLRPLLENFINYFDADWLTTDDHISYNLIGPVLLPCTSPTKGLPHTGYPRTNCVRSANLACFSISERPSYSYRRRFGSVKRHSIILQCAGPVDGPFDTASSTCCKLSGYASVLLFLVNLSKFGAFATDVDSIGIAIARLQSLASYGFPCNHPSSVVCLQTLIFSPLSVNPHWQSDVVFDEYGSKAIRVHNHPVCFLSLRNLT